MRRRPPRRFRVGHGIVLKDCGSLYLRPDEQVTFRTDSGAEYDVARKEWGFYATPSLNRRLVRYGFQAALVKNPDGRFTVMLVERGREASFRRYLRQQGHRVVAWLSQQKDLARIERAMKRK